MTYIQRELTQGLARSCGTGYELYSHQSGTWTPAAAHLRAEIKFSGSWSPISENEAQTLIADVASGAFYADTSSTNSSGGAEWRDPPAIAPMVGAEQFIGLDGTVMDFWRFAMSDFRTNNLRGYLAEFIVAKAVGSDQNRVEWDAYDVVTPDGITIEVKASAYLQAWAQRGPSDITFTSLRGKTWTPQTGYATEASYNADVYVCCVQTATDHSMYNPIDLNQWDFYVISRTVLSATSQKSLSLSRARELSGGPVTFSGLRSAIDKAV